MRTIVSFGGGVNGTAMLCGMVARGEKPDAILFADTGGENIWTYEHIAYFSEWLIQNGFPSITIVTYKTKKGRRITLEEEILKAKTYPSVTFGFKTCSQKHKIFPQQKWINYYYGKESITWCVGFDAGESYRVKDNPIPGHINRYPLIEWGLNREGCINEILKAGVKIPKKSACFFCRNLKKKEILELPEDKQKRAMGIESNAKPMRKVIGLGGSYSFTEVIKGNDQKINEEEKNAETFKKITGEELNPILCNCIG